MRVALIGSDIAPPWLVNSPFPSTNIAYDKDVIMRDMENAGPGFISHAAAPAAQLISSRRAFACFKSAVSNPSVNQP
jgi:hypothetical protein